MELERARTLLTELADGVDPLTGECLPSDSVCNRPEIIRGQLSSQFLRHGETAGHGKLTMWLLGNLMTNIAVQPDFIAYQFQDRKNPALAWCRKFYKVQEIDWTIRTKEEMEAAEAQGNLVIFECFDPKG